MFFFSMSQQYLPLNVTQMAYYHFMPHHKQTLLFREAAPFTQRGVSPQTIKFFILSALCLHEAGILNDQPHIFETEIQSGKV